MNYFIKILIVIGIIYFGLVSVKYQFGGYDLHVLYEFNFISISLLFILTTAAFYDDIVSYRKNNRIIHFPIGLLGLFFLQL